MKRNWLLVKTLSLSMLSLLAASCAAPQGETGQGGQGALDEEPVAEGQSALGTEVCDGADNDGDGLIDENNVCACTSTTWNGHSYTFCNTAVSWTAAAQACTASGKRLAKIETAAENTYLGGQTAQAGRWIGVNDQVHEGIYRWADGSRATYTSWGASEPNGMRNENCGQLYSTGAWNDLPCAWNVPFVCESTVEVCDGVDNDGDSLVDEGNVCSCTTQSSGGVTYKLCDASVPWVTAREACLGMGYDLANVSTQSESSGFNSFANSSGRWIGLSDAEQEGTWRWTDRQTTTAFHPWGASEPNGQTSENCGQFVKNAAYGAWNDLNCGWNATFACENVFSDVTVSGGTRFVGLTTPISSHAQLDEVENRFRTLAMPGVSTTILDAKTNADAQLLLAARDNHWEVAPTGEKLRKIEMVVSTELIDALKTKHGVNDFVKLMKAHEHWMQEVYASMKPSLNMKPVLDRVVVVTPAVLHDAPNVKGWWVPNNLAVSYWANDVMTGTNGVATPHIMPADIDSRWGLGADWETIFQYFNDYPTYNGCTKATGCAVDGGLIHELVHHDPVGDFYHSNFLDGASGQLPITSLRKLRLDYSQLGVGENEIMANANSRNMSAYNYQTLFTWARYPTTRRNGQHFFPENINQEDSAAFPQNVTINLTGLSALGITGCSVLHSNWQPGDWTFSPHTVTSVSLANGTCTVQATRDQIMSAYPGLWVMLTRAGVSAPVYLPRILFAMSVYKASYEANALVTVPSATVSIEVLPRFGDLLDLELTLLINQSPELTVNLPAGDSLYGVFQRDAEAPTYAATAIARSAALDSSTNRWVLGARF